MPKHISVRMAWHDSKWNGKVCNDPEGNIYCSGTHSLLSERLAKNRRVDVEKDNIGEKIDRIEGYQPPCFWSANAFAPEPALVTHTHPFRRLSEKKIDEKLNFYSVFTWPFRISFNHSQQKRNREGSYPKDLESRIENFREQFEAGESLVFFYLNYDNPVSADDYKRALVGCSVLSGNIVQPPHFNFSSTELSDWCKIPDFQNFPTINWALQISSDYENTGIVLPYQEYIRYIEQNPEEEHKLHEMRALIDEDALTPRFKYVAESLDDDKAIYLLYKLKKSISIIQEQGIVNVDREALLLNQLLKKAWGNRSPYPGLGSIIELLADPETETSGVGDKIVSLLRKHLENGENLLEVTISLLSSKSTIPDYLLSFTDIISQARISFRDHKALVDLLRKLSLFSLTKFQLFRIIFPMSLGGELHPFRRKQITPEQIIENPYILCEEYVATEQERDELQFQDEPIDVFTIDIGMFPDSQYQTRDYELQDMSPSSPERLRALIVEQLKRAKEEGHSFLSLDTICESILHHPLFYKEAIAINKEELISGRHRDYFCERLVLVENEGQTFFYLQEIKYAEELVETVTRQLMTRVQLHDINLTWIDEFLEGEAQTLAKRIPNFSKEDFKNERKQLLVGALTTSLYVITGKPGSGKTQTLKKVVEKLEERGEQVLLLAPTGKAALRAKAVTGFRDAETIDRFIFRNNFAENLEDLRLLIDFERSSDKPEIENLIIDESSMVDLDKLATVFAMLNLRSDSAVKRIILVGDENQLPPIGCGRPFFDLVEFLKLNKEAAAKHWVRLLSNCRQELDETILRAADIFVCRNKYYEELLDELQKGGTISEGLEVVLWEDREDLSKALDQKLYKLLDDAGCLDKAMDRDKEEALNIFLGQYATGYVPGNSATNLQLDRLQIISPYKSGFYGTLGLNQIIRDEYKENSWPDSAPPRSLFAHSEKVIRLENWYKWSNRERKRILILSNGSIGIVCNQRNGRAWYFPETDRPLWDIPENEEERFELAYAITVHKAQGSEFEHTFVIIPERKSLLSRELLYTALTRSTQRITVFLKRSENISPLQIAHDRSSILLRNTSLFLAPREARRQLEPEPGKLVKSKIEYIIYRTLMEQRAKNVLEFEYERELDLKDWTYPIKPDFTVRVGDRTYYWEHLGMLDTREYSKDWKKRRQGYEDSDLGDSLVTTDDLSGVRQELVDKVIEDMMSGNLSKSEDKRFSNYHYRLYPE